MSKVLEISSKQSKGGRRRIEIVLHKIPTDKHETNRNGIHWSEENTQRNIESVKGIPICAEFTDIDKEFPLGHGYTSTERIDGKDTPLFENSEVVGVIEKGEIKNVEVNGENIRALVGIGVLYDQRYPKFCSWVKQNSILSKVDSSIEIMGKSENNNKIIYDDGECNEEWRCPRDYDYSGVAILSVLPADSDAIVLECAQAKENNKEENLNMDEKELKSIIVSTITETNSVKEDMNAKITELNSQIEAKNVEIKELNEKLDAEKEAKETEVNANADKDKTIEELNTKIANLENELSACRKKELNSALDKAIETFSDDEKKFAESEINAFRENPENGNVDTIVSKIFAGIGQASKKAEDEAKIAEQNSVKENETIDIFSEMNSENTDSESEDTNIF